MKNQELQKFISSQKEKGVNQSTIIEKLHYVGWDQKTIIENLIEDDIPKPDIPKKGKASLWDAFEHIILFISLYVFAISFGLLLHYFVDRFIPGIDTDNYRYVEQRWQTSQVNGYIAAIIVSFPVFAFLFRRITKRTLHDPSLRSELARKLLTYATLIGTFITLLYQASRTIYSLLQGNITINFILHFAITSTIAAIIFTYYFNEVKEDRKALT